MSFMYPAKPAVTFKLPPDAEAQAAAIIGQNGVTALKIVFDGLGLSQATAADILSALLQNWKTIASRVVQNNGQDFINWLASEISALPKIPLAIKPILLGAITGFGPYIIQAILAQLA